MVKVGTGRFIARSVIGALFIGHGAQKLTGSFGGGGIDGTAEFMESLNLRPPRAHAIAAGITEAGCGAMLVAGYRTPVACAGLIATMFTAIRTAHLPHGVWNANGGYEYNAVLIASCAMLAETGPGPFSLDGLRGRQHQGSLWAIGALAAGALASVAVVEMAKRTQQPDVIDLTQKDIAMSGLDIQEVEEQADLDEYTPASVIKQDV